jgi:hypothetical protein
MKIITKTLEIIIASVIANPIASNIANASWLGVMNSVLAGSLIYLVGICAKKKSKSSLGGTTKKFLLLVSETLTLTAWCVFSAGVIFSWALANQLSDSSYVEKKRSEVVANEQESPQQFIETNKDKIW